MKREIKFRAWYTEEKLMINWNEWKDVCDVYNDYGLVSTDTWKVMQFTGLKDKNGVEIYEAHKVKARLGSNEYIEAYVEFHKGCFCVGVVPFCSLSDFEIVGDKFIN